MNDIIFNDFYRSGSLLSLDSDLLYVGFGKRIWLSEPANDRVSFYFPDFFLESNKPWFVDEHQVIISFESFQKKLSKCSCTYKLNWTYPNKKNFLEIFNELQEAFQTNKLDKAVPYFFAESDSNVDYDFKNHLLNHLLSFASDKPVYIYGVWGKGEGVLGATPELLFDLEGRRLKTVSCAGTYHVDQDDSYFLKDPKEIKEHQLVIRGIKESLESFGDIQIDPIQTVQFAHFKHLLTPIELKMDNDITPTVLVKHLHPTPALGAYPRIEGQKWLVDYQTRYPRRRFGAPVGYWDPTKGCGSFYVAIRNIQWDEDKIQIGAGCGVVQMSQYEQEWQEILMKLESVKRVFNI